MASSRCSISRSFISDITSPLDSWATLAVGQSGSKLGQRLGTERPGMLWLLAEPSSNRVIRFLFNVSHNDNAAGRFFQVRYRIENPLELFVADHVIQHGWCSLGGQMVLVKRYSRSLTRSAPRARQVHRCTPGIGERIVRPAKRPRAGQSEEQFLRQLAGSILGPRQLGQ